MHSRGLKDAKEHFAREHPEVTFREADLDFLCRICMEEGMNDDEEELLEHIKAKHKEFA